MASPLLLAAAPAIAEGALKIVGGLVAPSQRKKFKWERENALKLGQQRMSAVNASMRPKEEYFNMGKNMGPLYEMLNKLLAGKAGMYMGGGNQGASWGVNLPQIIQQLTAQQTQAPGGGGPGQFGGRPGLMPAWATTVKP